MDEVQVLEGWLDTPTVAEKLNVTRGRVWQMIKEGKFASDQVRQIGGNYVISAEAVAELIAAG